MTLDWNVRKARKAFEKELTSHGISESQARRMSEPIKTARDDVMNLLFHAGNFGLHARV